MDLDDCGVALAVGTPKWAQLAGWVAVAEKFAEVGGVVAFCGLCAVSGLAMSTMRPGSYILLVALVIVRKREPSLGRLARACGRGGWSPWESSGAR